MATLNESPSANRLHIGVFGKTNSGKSSFINAFTNQNVSIVSEIEGTTTDLVYKAMEINPLGPCVIIDTAGSSDQSKLGEKRLEKTMLAASKTDIAIVVLSVTDDINEIDNWYEIFRKKQTPILFIINKADLDSGKAAFYKEAIFDKIEEKVNTKGGQRIEALVVSSLTGKGIDKVRSALESLVPENYGNEFITGDLVAENDLVLLVMPQDIQAPKGRLILPQVQTIRELLDKKCLVVSVTTDKLLEVLPLLVKAPKLIITDSQVFKYVYDNKPKESMLTSFSVLFAAYKGDLPYYMEGARAIDSLNSNSKVLIAECCTHAPLQEDIGRVKIPNMLKKRFGQNLKVEVVSGTDFPSDIENYDLIIQCGACMFNKKYVMSRIEQAKEKKIPMTNYGVTIAHLTGILDKISIV